MASKPDEHDVLDLSEVEVLGMFLEWRRAQQEAALAQQRCKALERRLVIAFRRIFQSKGWNDFPKKPFDDHTELVIGPYLITIDPPDADGEPAELSCRKVHQISGEMVTLDAWQGATT